MKKMQYKKWKFFTIFFCFLNVILCDVNWNSDIVPNSQEIELEKNDALNLYFSNLIQDENFFRSKKTLQKIVGDFKDVPKNEQRNHNYTEMTYWLKNLTKKFPSITYLHSIGKSVENRELWVLVISSNPQNHEVLKPEFKYVANMHGNEVFGREALLYLAYIFCENYNSNKYFSHLLNTTRIHLLPSMNPDGYEKDRQGDRLDFVGRNNANNIDLNRNFPSRFFFLKKDEFSGSFTALETKAVMNWILTNPFVLSANLHGGSLVVNYPFDDSEKGEDGIYTPSLDDKLFVQLAYQYARAHTNMYKTGRRCGLSYQGDSFYHGITNGADWYHLSGGMQDWQYLHSNALEITIEMGCFKFPYDYMIPQLWSNHIYSLLSFIEAVHIGVKGIVSDTRGNPIYNATIIIVAGGSGKNITTTNLGEYWRILSPGNYTLKVKHQNFQSKQFNVFVKIGEVAKIINITLDDLPCFVEGKICSNLSISNFSQKKFNLTIPILFVLIFLKKYFKIKNFFYY